MNKKFHDFADAFFAEGRSVWVKVAACGAITPLIVLAGALKGERRGRNSSAADPTTSDFLWQNGLPLLVGAVAVGVLIGFALALKDFTAKRIREGQPVPAVLKLLFGSRYLSLAIWFFGTLLLVFVGAIGSIAIFGPF